MKTREKEYTFIYTILFIIFLLFLAYPIISLLAKSFQGINGFTLNNYNEVLKNEEFIIALKNSIVVSLSAISLHFKLHECLAVAEKNNLHDCLHANAITDNNLWLCNYLFLW